MHYAQEIYNLSHLSHFTKNMFSPWLLRFLQKIKWSLFDNKIYDKGDFVMIYSKFVPDNVTLVKEEVEWFFLHLLEIEFLRGTQTTVREMSE